MNCKTLLTSSTSALSRARLHVSTLIVGHLQAFLQSILQILCMFGSHHVYIIIIIIIIIILIYYYYYYWYKCLLSQAFSSR